MKECNTTKKRNEGKRHYEKPLLTLIDLAADEVLVVNCKTVTGPGQIGSCLGGGLSPCYQAGS